MLGGGVGGLDFGRLKVKTHVLDCDGIFIKVSVWVR